MYYVRQEHQSQGHNNVRLLTSLEATFLFHYCRLSATIDRKKNCLQMITKHKLFNLNKTQSSMSWFLPLLQLPAMVHIWSHLFTYLKVLFFCLTSTIYVGRQKNFSFEMASN